MHNFGKVMPKNLYKCSPRLLQQHYGISSGIEINSLVNMAPQKIPLSHDKLDKPLQHGQADEPMVPPIENSDFDSEADSDSSDSEFNDSLNEYIGLMPLYVDQAQDENGSMIVQQGSGEDLETSSDTDPTLAELLQTSDSDEADDIENRWSPILFLISPMSAEESDDALMPAGPESDEYMGDLELGSSDDDELPHEMCECPNTEDGYMGDLDLGSSDEAEMPHEKCECPNTEESDGYMGDIESGIEIDDYTVNPREELGQEELMIISAEQHIANGLERLTQFRIPPPTSAAICPICQINK